jgi:protein-disulfide isomerase
MIRAGSLAAAILLAAAPLMPALADPPQAALTVPQKAEIDQMIHDYLMNHPDVLAQAIAHAEDDAKATDAAAQSKLIAAHKEDLERDPASPVLGDPNGDVTLVEFFDYRCPYCRASAPSVRALLKSDPRLRLVLKEFPILGADSVYASRVALVAQRHGKYQAFFDAMWAAKDKPGQDAVLRIAKSVGLDPDSVKKEMESPEIDQMLKRNFDLAQTLKFDGTPTFVIGTTAFPGATSIDDLRARIAAIRKGDG